MALLPDVFIPEDEEDDPFAPIPATWYLALIPKSEVKATKDKKGKYIALTFKVVQGEFKDRLLWTNLNIVNKSEVAVRIARSDLKKICTACEIEGELEDTTDLHNIDMWIKVTIKPETSQWPAKNEIKDFRHADSDMSDVIEDDEENPLEDD